MATRNNTSVLIRGAVAIAFLLYLPFWFNKRFQPEPSPMNLNSVKMQRLSIKRQRLGRRIHRKWIEAQTTSWRNRRSHRLTSKFVILISLILISLILGSLIQGRMPLKPATTTEVDSSKVSKRRHQSPTPPVVLMTGQFLTWGTWESELAFASSRDTRS